MCVITGENCLSRNKYPASGTHLLLTPIGNLFKELKIKRTAILEMSNTVITHNVLIC